MRAVFSVLCLLIVVALVGFLAGRQLKALRGEAPSAAPAAAVPGGQGAVPAAPARPNAQQIGAEMKKALEEGAAAAARRDEDTK